MKMTIRESDIINQPLQKSVAKELVIAPENLNKSFKEEQHPRDERGRFTKGGQRNGQNNQDGRKSGADATSDEGGAEGSGDDGRGDSGISGRIGSVSQEQYPSRADHEYDYHRIEGGDAHEVFGKAVADAKDGNPYGAFVDAYDADDYKGVKTILSDGGEAGIGVKPDGDIVSVFHNKDIKKEGKGKVVPHLLELALKNGGDRLDCFDKGLATMYAKMGFEPVARMKFDREYAPEGWNFERDGEPDVVFMAHNGDDVDTVMNTDYPKPDMSEVPYITDYDDGAKYQQAHVEKKKDPVTKSFSDVHGLMKGW